MGSRYDAERENVGCSTWSQNTAYGDTRGDIEITDDQQRRKRSVLVGWHWALDTEWRDHGVLAHPSILDRVMEKEAAAQEKKYRDKRYL